MSEMSSMFVYVGTYTASNESKGIYVYDLDLASGALEPRSTASGVVNPSFLELHPNDVPGHVFTGVCFRSATEESFERKNASRSLNPLVIDSP